MVDGPHLGIRIQFRREMESHLKCCLSAAARKRTSSLLTCRLQLRLEPRNKGIEGEREEKAFSPGNAACLRCRGLNVELARYLSRGDGRNISRILNPELGVQNAASAYGFALLSTPKRNLTLDAAPIPQSFGTG